MAPLAHPTRTPSQLWSSLTWANQTQTTSQEMHGRPEVLVGSDVKDMASGINHHDI